MDFCLICGANIDGKINSGSKYCSGECRNTGLLRSGEKIVSQKCVRCGRKFFRLKQSVNCVYCLYNNVFSCENCGKNIFQKCSARIKRFCSLKCVSEVRIRKRVKKFVCTICGEVFDSALVSKKSASKACGKKIEAKCVCGKIFSEACRKNCRQYCSSGCAKRYRKSFVADRECLLCGKIFIATHHTQKYCTKIFHETRCGFCGEKFMKRIRTDRKTKDSYCSKMCLKMSSVDDAEPGNIDEYRRLSTIVNPKTKLSDAQQKTKTVLTKNLLRAIKLDPRLNLENIVVEEIEKYGHQVVLHSRPLKKDGKSYEIDILVPHLNLGFEVQDFWTHSRISDYEKFQYGIKSGPKKHEWKRKEAKDSHGIILVDIWEDDILSGAYKKIVSSVIENVTHNRHVETLLTRF